MLCVTLTVLVILGLATTARAADNKVWTVTGVSGRSSDLPCYLNPRTPGDRPKLILWYKKGIRAPVFSYDGRRMREDLHMAEGVVNRRMREDLQMAEGVVSLTRGTASLTLAQVTLLQAGLYECRVEFFRSPSHTSLVNLTVVETPRTVEVLDRRTGPPQDGVLGPYQEGVMVIFTCLARDGWPLPKVSWWRGSQLQDGGWEVSGPRLVRNDLVISRLTRDWHNDSLTCTASNTNLVPPISVSTTIHMYLLPTSVVITGSGTAALEGQVLRLRCTSRGSRPSARLTWMLEDYPMVAEKENTVYRRVTSSTLLVNVSREYNGARVKCRAANPAMPASPLTNTTTITVHYPPVVRASLGPSLRPGLLKEGDDVYFTCHVDANPPAIAITWYHEGQLQVQNVSAGVILSGDSLVVQQVHRARTGRYRCQATNSLATVTSDPVILRIKYAPECHTSPTTYFIYDKPIKVTCTISSYPAVTSVQWQWNSSSEVMRTSPVSQLQGEEVRKAQLTVFPEPEVEDRALSCWAANHMGSNKHRPCAFSIKVAKTPLPLSSCRLANITASWLSLTCQRPQRYRSPSTILYRAEVYFENHTLFANVTSLRPSFNVSRLDAETSYQIKVYVSQGPVTSQPVVVSAYTSRTSLAVRGGLGRTRASKVGGCVGGIIVTVVMVGGAVWARRYCWRRRRSGKLRTRPSPDDPNPDVVPNIADDTHDLLCLTDGKSEDSLHQVLDNPAHHLTPLHHQQQQLQQQQTEQQPDPVQQEQQRQSVDYSTEVFEPLMQQQQQQQESEQQQCLGYSKEVYEPLVQQQQQLQGPHYQSLVQQQQQQQQQYQPMVLKATVMETGGGGVNARYSVRSTTYCHMDQLLETEESMV